MEFLRGPLINGGRLYVNYEDLMSWLDDLRDLDYTKDLTNTDESTKKVIAVTSEHTLKEVRRSLKIQRSSVSI